MRLLLTLLMWCILLPGLLTQAPPPKLLSRSSLTTLSRNTHLVLQEAWRDTNTGTMKVLWSIQLNLTKATSPHLRALCSEHGMIVCVSVAPSLGDGSFMGFLAPAPCTVVTCNQDQTSTLHTSALPSSSSSSSSWSAGTIVWNGAPGIMLPPRGVIYIQLAVKSAPTVILSTSNQVVIVRSTFAIIPIAASTTSSSTFSTSSTTSTPSSSAPSTSTSNTLLDTDNGNSILHSMRLGIDFPPPNAEIWAQDLRVSTIIEVDDPLEFAKKQDQLRACFLLEMVSSPLTTPTTFTTTASKPSVSFCEELDVSVLRFKHLNNGTYLLTLWMMELEKKPTTPHSTMIPTPTNSRTSGSGSSAHNNNNNNNKINRRSNNVTRMFVVRKGSDLPNAWTTDPRIRLLRPSPDPTTVHKYRGWPCAHDQPPTIEQKTDLDASYRTVDSSSSLLPTARAVLPWRGNEQLTIPQSWKQYMSVKRRYTSFDNPTTSLALKKRVLPLTSYAWEYERDESTDVVLVLGIKVEATGFAYRQALRETWMQNKGDSPQDVKIWFIIGSPKNNTNEKILDQILQEAMHYQDMLLGGHPYWTSISTYPWHVLHVRDSYYTLVEKTMTFMEFSIRTYPHFQYLVSFFPTCNQFVNRT